MDVRQRKTISGGKNSKSFSNVKEPKKSGNHGQSKKKQKTEKQSAFIPYWLIRVWQVLGVLAAVTAGYIHAKYMFTLHDNYLWFSHITEVEREISFRTESGLYYSYYKQLIKSPSIAQGWHDLMYDNITEHPSTINIIERMNIHQEILLASIYKSFSFIQHSFQPIYFYINTIFTLHAMLVGCLFLLTWMLSNSWLAGILTSCFYIFNRMDTTRVEYVIPLRESFSLPFLWLQLVAISYYLRDKTNPVATKLSIAVIALSTFAFTLFWQFSQFILLLQAFSLFGVWILDVVPSSKIKPLLIMQAGSILFVCILQFTNKMLLGSLVLSFNISFWLLILFRGNSMHSKNIFLQFLRVAAYSVAVLTLMVVVNILIKFLIGLEADEHIFKFVQSKFGFGYSRDFDSRLYLCNGAFGFLEWETFLRLSRGFVFPVYAVSHAVLIYLLALTCFKYWSMSPNPNSNITRNRSLLRSRPDMAFHIVQAAFFGCLAMSTLRMKYLWTPYMCVLASVGLADYSFWKTLISKFSNRESIIFLLRHLVTGVVLASVLITFLPGVYRELEDLKEFWDPDTVELMEWIKTNTSSTAAFSGSMQLLAGVKLCTGRPITNHPHYEHKGLRYKTKEIYQIYGRKPPAEVYSILKYYRTNYIILEDSICLSASREGCRTPDLVDVANGEIPEFGEKEPGLVQNTHPRFCHEIRYGNENYAKYFRLVFENRTFRVYKLL